MNQSSDTAVDVLEGEVVGAAALTEAEARELTGKIKVALGMAWELVVEAYRRRVWLPLEYPSWDEYCRSELGAGRFKLPLEERRQVVKGMREQALSLSAIGSALGIGRTTVDLDIRMLTKRGEGPDVTKITGPDGKTYPIRNRRGTVLSGVPLPDRGRPFGDVLEEQLERLGHLAETARDRGGAARLAEAQRVLIAEQARRLRPLVEFLEGLAQ